MMVGAFTELRQAARALARRPGYTAVSALTLALGIGANVAIFTVLNAVVLRPLAYPDSDRIVDIRHHAPGLNMADLNSSPGLIVQYRQAARTLGSVAGYRTLQLNLADGGAPERVRVAAVSPELFDVLATQPAWGRRFNQEDALSSSRRVSLLTYPLWQSRFGGDSAVIGRTVQLDGQATEVIGVMPRGFMFPDAETRLLIPFRIDPSSGFGDFGVTSLARLAPGASLESARQEIDRLQQRIPEWFPGLTKETLEGFGWSVTMQPLQERMVSDVSTTLWILLGTVGFVLLIAGANVANLYLVRAESRQHEIAVRSALGAARIRIAATFLAESLLLAAIGGFTGLLIGGGATRLLVAYGPAQLPRLQEVQTDGAVVALAAVLSVLSAIALGLLPMWTIGRRAIGASVRERGRGTTAARSQQRLRQVLIVTQVAMALVLLVGSGLMLRSVARLHAVDPGFRRDGLLTAGVSLGTRADRERAVAFYHRALDEMSRLPGVTAAGAASNLPVAASSLKGGSFAVRSRPRPAQNEPPLFTMYSAVTAGYFETLGVPLFEGRLPERADAELKRPVAWVNSALARQFLSDRALGESIQIDGQWLEIVGVVGDLKTFGLRERARPMAYVPISNASVPVDVMYAVVRCAGAATALAPALRSAIDRVDASVPLTTTRTMEDLVAGTIAQTSFTMTLLIIAAGIALVLGVVGLYGVISYIVTQRTVEIGIRVALGATPGELSAMILRQGLTVALVGIVVGVAVALASTRLMASLLFEVSEKDPVTFAAVALILAVVSALASYLPARRAAGIDPIEALRGQG
jgi:predicted permease